MQRLARFYNPIITWLLRIGAPMGPMALLTVSGRRTGQPRSVPIAIVPEGEGWHLTAVYGVVDWVKNLRRAGRAELTFRARRVPVQATELSPTETAPRLRQVMADAGPSTTRMLAPYFRTPVDAPLGAWESEAADHPMFYLEPALETPTPKSRALRALVTVLIIGIVVQVFLAGMGAFGADWEAHAFFGVVVEAVALVAAIVSIVVRQVGARWLTVGIFLLITLQHGTAAIGSGLAAGLHPVNALVMLAMAWLVRRRLKPSSSHLPAASPGRADPTPVVEAPGHHSS